MPTRPASGFTGTVFRDRAQPSSLPDQRCSPPSWRERPPQTWCPTSTSSGNPRAPTSTATTPTARAALAQILSTIWSSTCRNQRCSTPRPWTHPCSCCTGRRTGPWSGCRPWSPRHKTRKQDRFSAADGTVLRPLPQGSRGPGVDGQGRALSQEKDSKIIQTRVRVWWARHSWPWMGTPWGHASSQCPAQPVQASARLPVSAAYLSMAVFSRPWALK